ncbi:hypothetical protein SRB5_29990 [Streptomyces sp. RB5]|uniref:Acyl-CoA dehydrogenase/oxidase C-terminal domain-containing protein n=1 Tax=Streptomyces smaragdinus TaxID=2585196 RepID=A0A7K0CHA3_9ACTN|nr:acyl-CoA dehydrogenase family protein [Streptomyces smaragdinus]MQY12860.1 hypothetical protein [Streptomyces smaragdinus]
MDTTPAPAHVKIRRALTDVLDDELAPLVRRMADRSPHAPDDGAEVRAMVAQALTGLGIPALNHTSAPGDLYALQSLAGVCEALGELLYQGPLMDTVLTAEALRRAGRPADPLLDGIAAGTTVTAAWRDGAADPWDRPLDTGADGRLTAERRHLVGAAEAGLLLVTGRTPEGEPRTALLDRNAVRLRRQSDLGRSELYAARAVRAPVRAWIPLDDAGRAGLTASRRILQAAYLVGLGAGALRLGCERARERRQFGKPIARQQSVAFTLARLAVRIDAARLLVRAAACEADLGEDCRLTAAQGLAMAAEVAVACVRDVLQVHGSYGLTEDCDAQLYYRRALYEARALGSPARLRAEVLPLLRARTGQSA